MRGVCVVCAGVISCRLVAGVACLSVDGPSDSLLPVPVSAVTTCTAVTDTTAVGKLRL